MKYIRAKWQNEIKSGSSQIALKEERHQYILELLGSEAESSPRTLAVDTGSLKTRFVEICANWRVREDPTDVRRRSASPCRAVPFVSRQQIDMEKQDRNCSGGG